MKMPKQFQRPVSPAPSGYAAAGDILRVLCVFMVAWYHIWQQSWLNPNLYVGTFKLNMDPYVRAGYMYVDLMLMLSGFLLYLPYANKKEQPVRTFFLRRAGRILPSYWLCLAVMFVYAVVQPDFTNMKGLIEDLLAHLSFTHNLFGFSYTETRLNVVLWTLAVEVQFYLILPVLAPLFRKRPLLCYLAMTGVALSFQRLWSGELESTRLFANRLPNMLDVYANGMLAAHIYAALARRRDHRALIATLGSIAAILGLWLLLRIMPEQAYAPDQEAVRHGQLVHRWPFSFGGALFLLGGSLSFEPVRRAFSNSVVRFLSGVSFNYYIWHQWLAVRLKLWRIPPYAAAENPNMAGEMPWQLIYTLFCFFGALLLATLVTYLVEKPCARLARRLESTRGAASRRKKNDAGAAE